MFTNKSWLFNSGSTVADVARKVLGDAPLAYVEGEGGVRVPEDGIVSVGKYDVCHHVHFFIVIYNANSVILSIRYCHSRLVEVDLDVWHWMPVCHFTSNVARASYITGCIICALCFMNPKQC